MLTFARSVSIGSPHLEHQSVRTIESLFTPSGFSRLNHIFVSVSVLKDQPVRGIREESNLTPSQFSINLHFSPLLLDVGRRR